MENIAIFYGGKSVEHEVSIITAQQIMQNIDGIKYKIYPVFIDKEGKWWQFKNYLDKRQYINKKAKKNRIFLKIGEPYLLIKKVFFFKKVKIDACLNCCHGTYGEDGVLQGVLDSLNVANSGPCLLPSAICMNKTLCKKLFEFYGLPITKYFELKRNESVLNLNEKCEEIGYPLFVKPCSLGSSVGISKCSNLQEVKSAMKIAFEFDEDIIIEKAVENLKEINCSVQIINGQICTSELEMPISWEKFLTYEEKYISKNKNSTKRIIGVKLAKNIKKQIEDISVFTYKTFNLSGVIRIDFLFDEKEKKVYINEINTIPGSLAFYLWKVKGISLKTHIDLQIEQAKDKLKTKQKNKTNFKSNILI